MDVEQAGFYLDTIALGAVALWAIGAWFVRGTRLALETPVAGEVRVPIAPDVVLDAVARRIALGGDVLRAAAIDAADARQVTWHSAVAPRHSGTVTAERVSNGSRVTWQVDASRSLFGARLVVVAGAVWIAALYVALRTLVLPSEDDGVRAQVFQMVQAIHLVWPAFLLAGLARVMRRRLVAEVERIVQNARFHAQRAVAR